MFLEFCEFSSMHVYAKSMRVVRRAIPMIKC